MWKSSYQNYIILYYIIILYILLYSRQPPQRPPEPLYLPDDQRAPRVMYPLPVNIVPFLYPFPSWFFTLGLNSTLGSGWKQSSFSIPYPISIPSLYHPICNHNCQQLNINIHNLYTCLLLCCLMWMEKINTFTFTFFNFYLLPLFYPGTGIYMCGSGSTKILKTDPIQIRIHSSTAL